MASLVKSIGDVFRRAPVSAGISGANAASGAPALRSATEVARWQATATVYTCADLIAKSIGQVRFTCEDAYWQRTLDAPNLFQTRYQFLYSVAWDATVFGNAYIEREADRRGSSNKLAPLDATTIEPDGTIGRPAYRERGGGERISADRIIHVRHGGGTGLEAIGRVAGGWSRIKALGACDRQIDDVFDNGLLVQHVLQGGHADETAVKKMLRSVRKAFGTGGNRRGGVVGLTGGFQLETIKGLTPADGDLRDLRSDLIREIAALFGVPAFAVGGSTDTKFSNTVQRHQAMNQQALLPLARNIRDTFSQAFGEEVTFQEHDVLAGDFALQFDLAISACGGAVYTPNESRKRFLGEDAIEGGDVLRTGPAGRALTDDLEPNDGSESDR